MYSAISVVAAVACGAIAIAKVQVVGPQSVGWIYWSIASISMAAMFAAVIECVRTPAGPDAA